MTTDSADDTTDNDCSPSSSSSRNVLSGPAHDDSLTSTTPQRFVPPDPGLYQTDHDSDYDESEILKMNQLGVDQQQQQDDDEEFCSPSKRQRLHTRSSNNPFILYEAEEASASSIEDGDNDEEEEEAFLVSSTEANDDDCKGICSCSLVVGGNSTTGWISFFY